MAIYRSCGTGETWGSNTINIPRFWRSGPEMLIPMIFYLHSPQLVKAYVYVSWLS
jgi:hypothetical protein